MPGPPVDLAAPAASGELEEGATLTANAGTWAGTAPIAYGYQWQRCGHPGEACEAIPGSDRLLVHA